MQPVWCYAVSQEALLVLGYRCAASDLGAGSITGLCHLPGLLLPADYYADDSGGGDNSAGTLPAFLKSRCRKAYR